MIDTIDYGAIGGRYPWLLKRDQDCILSPDSDGMLCGLLMSHLLGWNIVGFYDGKRIFIKNGKRVAEAVFLDMEIYRKNIRSVGQHLVLYNKRQQPSNWNNFINCLSPNNLRQFDQISNFQQKYPFGTIHLLLGFLQHHHRVNSITSDAHWPLLFTDGVWNNLFGYTENCLEWIHWLRFDDPKSILYSVFCKGTSVYETMIGINTFLRLRDSCNSREQYVAGERLVKKGARTGDKLQFTNSKGEPTNIKEKNDIYAIVDAEKNRIIRFIDILSRHTGWQYKQNHWSWNNLRMVTLSKGIVSASSEPLLSTSTFNSIMTRNPFSLAITSRTGLEYSIVDPGQADLA